MAAAPAPRLPLVVRSGADLQALLAHPAGVRKLPWQGVRVSIPELDAAQNLRLQQRQSAFIRACGCAEGGAAGLLCLAGVMGAIGLRIAANGPQWADLAWAALGVLLAVLCGGLGKLAGLALARARFQLGGHAALRALDRAATEPSRRPS
jgi:hypothetical protein